MSKGKDSNFVLAEADSLLDEGRRNGGRETLSELMAEAKILLIKLTPEYSSLDGASFESFILVVVAAVGVPLFCQGLLFQSAWSEYFIVAGALLTLASAVGAWLRHQKVQRRRLLERRAALLSKVLSEWLGKAEKLQAELSAQQVVERELEPV